MIKTNWHTHTSRCGHAVGTDEEYVQAAIQGGLTTLGFSDHAAYTKSRRTDRMDLEQFPERSEHGQQDRQVGDPAIEAK